MARVHLSPEQSVLVVIDIQPGFMKAVHEADRVLRRSLFLIKMANVLGIPVVGTEQYPAKMGHMDEAILEHLPATQIVPKMSFSCCGAEDFMKALGARHQVVLVGAETHICVALTTQDLLQRGYQVVVCPDAISARSEDRHKLGMEHIRDAGGVPSHTETVAYEWLRTAENPNFKQALSVVKDAGL